MCNLQKYLMARKHLQVGNMVNLITLNQTNSNQEIRLSPDQIEKNVSLINVVWI